MQFKVPQNVQRADQIVGPLTLRQLIICGVGGMIAYGLYVSLAKYYIWITWVPPVGIVALITLAFAFIRPIDLNFERWILLWIEFFILPRKRTWIQASAEVLPSLTTTEEKPQTKAEEQAVAKAESIEDKHKKIAELTKILNTQPSSKP